MDELFSISASLLVFFVLWLIVLPIVLLVQTRRLKASHRALQKEFEELTARLTRLDDDIQKLPGQAQTVVAQNIRGRDAQASPSPGEKEETGVFAPSLSAPAMPAASASVATRDILRIPEPGTPVAKIPPPDAEQDGLAKTVRAIYYPETEAPPAAPAPPLPETPSLPPPEPASARHDRQDSPDAVLPAPSCPNWLERAFSAGKVWLLGGNTVLRVGVALLFIGLAFLLRYASEQFVVPVEYRYIGVGLSALALLALGWRLRLKKAAYGLVLQGTGIAVLYLTTFAALRLHPLLSSSEALLILVSVTLCAVILAVAQNALGLAVAAALGGFAAPILTSTGGGNHVALFGYFALLNTAILLIAWFKAWRILNLIGFVSTFGIGFAWGMRAYTPVLLESTEPFLLLFFLMYVAIGLLFARRRLLEAENAPEAGERGALLRWSAGRTDYLDGGMIFGPPLVGFGLQCALIAHVEFGMAFSALALGVFYFVLALCLRGKGRLNQASLLAEICLALGVVFGTLAIPLALDARWTSAAWAVEGAGIYWLGLRQSRRLARAFALLLMLGAALAYLNGLGGGVETLINGSPLGAAMLGAALLFSYRELRRARAATCSAWEARCQSVLSVAGLAFLYLIAPLCFDLELSVISWALAGLLTLLAGLRLNARAFLFCAFGIQLLGGVIFLLNLRPGVEGQALDFGGNGLLCASLMGFALIASTLLAQRDARIQAQPGWSNGFGAALLAGLILINLAALFVLDLTRASAVWAGSGLLIFWLGLVSRQRLAFYFGLFLEAVGGMAFLLNGAGTYFFWEPELTPLGHFGFWTPAALALAALACAWRLHRAAADADAKRPDDALSAPFPALSNLLLVWGVGWWVWTAVCEIGRFHHDTGIFEHMALIALSFSATLWMLLARREQWRALALSCLLPLAAASLILLRGEGSLLEHLGAFAWPLFFGAHFLILRRLVACLPERVLTGAHVLGCWLLVGALAISAHDAMIQLAEARNAWRWLGWALAPSLYLLLATSRRRGIWPLSAYPRAYRFYAALLVGVGLMFWFWLANLSSNGASEPLPYLPLVNPLELGLMIVLMTVYRWSRDRLPETGLPAPLLTRGIQTVGGVSLLALLTLAVCRTAHHWGGTPFEAEALLASMPVQAGWSLIWTLYALALMIGGNRRGHRGAWMVGAVLVGVVVVKLLFVELGNSGSLARIVSFIGVGVLLLIVGYFSPLPPRAQSTKLEANVSS
jgi:uncharacterized membrane protein